MASEDLKRILERKLANAITGLHISASRHSLKEIWLDLGIVVGFDIALREYCLMMGEATNASYRNSHYMRQLDAYGFRKLKLEQIRNFAFPQVTYEA
jgi:hypothetical protein